MHEAVSRDRSGPVLVLGGTGEGRELAAALVSRGRAVISSLAGRVSVPRRPDGALRVGGFGGVEGMVEYLTMQRISTVIDATHPFAAAITDNAAAACARTGTPFLVLRRPPWLPVDGDDWTMVPDVPAAAEAVRRLDPEAAVLLTTGRQSASSFSGAPQQFWLRAVDPPESPLPTRCVIILDRGPFTLDGELELLRRLGIDVIVTKNSGGEMTSAKLTAARRLGLPVLMVMRPPLPVGVVTVNAVPAAVTWCCP